MEPENKGRDAIYTCIALVAGLVVFTFWGLNAFIVGSFPVEARGITGDMFGAVNALFTGLALVGLVYGMLMQRYEVRLAKDDLRRTKEILDQQEHSLQEQNANSKKQNFEQTLFNLVGVYQSIVLGLEAKFLIQNAEWKPATGKEYFLYFFKEIENLSSKSGSAVDEVYSKRCEMRSYDLNSYYRTVFFLFEYIDISDIDDKERYAKLIRGIFSDQEVALIGINAMTKYGQNFKPLINKYGILNNIPENSIIANYLRARFEDGAFE